MSRLPTQFKKKKHNIKSDKFLPITQTLIQIVKKKKNKRLFNSIKHEKTFNHMSIKYYQILEETCLKHF